jgi:hypothetical protein
VNGQATVAFRKAVAEITVVGIPYAFAQKNHCAVRSRKTTIMHLS